MSFTVVIAHHNKPLAVLGTLLRFSLFSRIAAEFVLVDNGSTRLNRLIVTFIGKVAVRHFKVLKRQNTGREAGAYWHFIRNTADPSRVVLFIQDQIHRRGMTPSNIPRWFSPANSLSMPFYPGRIRMGSLDLIRVEKLLTLYPSGMVGFGGKRCAQGLQSDSRFTGIPWATLSRELGLGYFDFFSGACFAVSESGFNFLKGFKDLPLDETLPYYAHYWERLWGSIFVKSGFPLIDFHSAETTVWHSVGVSKTENGRWWTASLASPLTKEFVQRRLTDT